MKTQLLEDIGENHSEPIICPENAASAAAPRAEKWRAGPWRHRETPAFAAPPPPPPPPERPIHAPAPDPLAECWAIANPGTEPTWFDRWGRRAAQWSAGLAGLVLVAGGAAWMYTETKTDQALAVASAALDAPVPAYVTRAPIEAAAPLDVQASELAPLAMDFQAGVPDFAPARVAAKPPRRRLRAVAKAPPPPDPAAIRESQMAETLRQCRAAGYHAGQCVKRGCVATPYGIACKG